MRYRYDALWTCPRCALPLRIDDEIEVRMPLQLEGPRWFFQCPCGELGELVAVLQIERCAGETVTFDVVNCGWSCDVGIMSSTISVQD